MPMVVGLLITSSGQRQSGVGRTGRYKIYPVAGTAIMLVGFVLLSRMNAATPMPLQSLYLLILGAGIGMCMQVLVLIVQNTSDFTDLGVATSGVTFFRTIGSSFGAAIFGSLFAGFLSDRVAGRVGRQRLRRPSRVRSPAGAAQTPARRRRPDRRTPTPMRWIWCSCVRRRWRSSA